MSYNISRFVVKEIDNFRIPIHALFNDNMDEDLLPENISTGTGRMTLEYGDCTEIRGVVDESGEVLEVDSISCYGEFSGTLWDEVLEPALTESKGTLRAIIVWECGEEVNEIGVFNGIITYKDLLA